MPVYGCAEPSYIVSATGRHDTITLFSHEPNKIAVEICKQKSRSRKTK